jgi:hypothetical protein
MNCKVIIIAVLLSINLDCFGQSNRHPYYFINGLSTAEDIGGVEVSKGYYPRDHVWYNLVFENFNNFKVTVIFEVATSQGKKTGTIILEAGEIKMTNYNYVNPSSFVLIVRRLN